MWRIADSISERRARLRKQAAQLRALALHAQEGQGRHLLEIAADCDRTVNELEFEAPPGAPRPLSAEWDISWPIEPAALPPSLRE